MSKCFNQTLRENTLESIQKKVVNVESLGNGASGRGGEPNAPLVNFCFLNSLSDFWSQCTWKGQLPRGEGRPAQRVRGVYSGSLCSFSFSASLSSRAITKECE